MANITYNDHGTETSIADTDFIPFWKTAPGAAKKLSWAYVKSILKTYLDSLYAPITVTNFDDEFIRGLEVTWVSATAITIGKGKAWIKDSGAYLEATSAIALTGLSGLTASTWYYVYFYDSGGATAEISTTVPVMDGQYYSYKTGAAARRCIGAILTDASENIYPFITSTNGHKVDFRWQTSNYGGPFRVLSAGADTTSTSVSLTGVVPDVIFDTYWFAGVLGISADTKTFIAVNGTAIGANDNQTQYYTALSSYAADTLYLPSTYINLATRGLYYLMSTTGTGVVYIDSNGFGIKR